MILQKLREPLEDATRKLNEDREAYMHGVHHGEEDHHIAEPKNAHERLEETLAAAGYAAGIAKENVKDVGAEVKDRIKHTAAAAADAVKDTAAKTGERVADEVCTVSR